MPNHKILSEDQNIRTLSPFPYGKIRCNINKWFDVSEINKCHLFHLRSFLECITYIECQRFIRFWGKIMLLLLAPLDACNLRFRFTAPQLCRRLSSKIKQKSFSSYVPKDYILKASMFQSSQRILKFLQNLCVRLLLSKKFDFRDFSEAIYMSRTSNQNIFILFQLRSL